MMRYGGAGAPPGMFPRWSALVDHDHDDDVDGVDDQEEGTGDDVAEDVAQEDVDNILWLVQSRMLPRWITLGRWLCQVFQVAGGQVTDCVRFFRFDC